MYRLRRVHPPDKVVLDNVSLSFLPGRQDRRAGRERGGQVHAAADHGRARPRASPARRSSRPAPPWACCRRSPTSTPPRTCAATSRRASPSTVGLLRRFEEIGARLGEVEPDEMEALLAEYQEVQDEIERRNAWDLERKLDVAMDALRVPPGDQDVTHPLRRRAPPRRPLPPAALGARPAAARRAHQPPRRRVGRLARAPPRGVPRHRRRRDPRPLLPRQRGRLDPRARPRPAASPGRATTRPGSSRSACAWSRRRRASRRARRPSPASWSGCAARRARARPRARRASRTTSAWWPRRASAAPARSRSASPRRRAWATWSWRPRASPRATATAC